MIIIKPTDTFRKIKFDGKVYDSSGNEVSGFASVAPSDLPGSNTSDPRGFILEVPGNTFIIGDTIIVTEDDKIERDNVVENVGKDGFIKMRDALENTDPQNNIEVRNKAHIVTATDIEEDIYTFSDNEALLVSKSFANVHISLSDLINRDKRIPHSYDIIGQSQEAVKSVYADFSINPTFYKTVDLSQLRELVILKMLSFYEASLGDSTLVFYRNQYSNFKKKVFNLMNRDEDILIPNTLEEAKKNPLGGRRSLGI